jgi:4-amino-4-deoxy-L-arabinose transferase-like glycosyltransferase
MAERADHAMATAPPRKLPRVNVAPAVLAAGAVAAISSVLFVAFAMIAPAGLPYDEPSHFGTLEHYAVNHAMPVMGEPGVSYEAQNGPVYYASTAPMFRAVDATASRSSAFHAARLWGLLAWIATLWFTFVCVRHLMDARSAAVAVALIGLNPAIIAVASSIQNDGLTIALCVAALVLAIRSIERGEVSTRQALAFGALAGVAILTKLHAVLVVGPAFVAMVVAAPRHRWRVLAVCAGSVALISGWWFVRNQRLYGDWTGRAGVRRTGVDFPPEDLTVRGVWTFARGVFGYLWTPAEYYRNIIDTPRWYEVVAILLTGFAIVGLVRVRPAFTRAGASMSAVAGVFCVVLAVLYFTASSLAGRLLYPLAPLYAAVLILGFRGWGSRASRAFLAATIAAQFTLALVVLRDLASIPDGGWSIALGDH